jgi:hypothetical protein
MFDFILVCITQWVVNYFCCNLNLGLATKARACKGVGQEEARESHFMLLGAQKSVRECTLTLPSELPLWEFGVLMDSQIFRERLKGSKPIGLKNSLYH